MNDLQPAIRIVSADIGGTHTRFAIATIEASGVELGQPVTLRTGDYASFESAFNRYLAVPAICLCR
jgi:glucokinase